METQSAKSTTEEQKGNVIDLMKAALIKKYPYLFKPPLLLLRFYYLIGIVLLICLAYLGASWAKNSFRRINLDIVRPNLSGGNQRIPAIDPVNGSVYDLYWRYGFDFTSNRSSKVIQSLKKEQLSASDLLSKNEYKSLFNLTKELYVSGRTNDEFEVLESWVKQSQFKISTGNIWHLIIYIEDVYIEPIPESITSYQFNRIRWLSHEAAKRVRLIQTPPLSTTDPVIRDHINKILLYESLFWNTSICFAYPKETRFLFDIIKNDYPVTSKPNLIQIVDWSPNLSFEHYKNYWLGLFEFQAKNFIMASDHFKKASTILINSKLKDLSLLMFARSLFWRYKTELSQKQMNNQEVQPPNKNEVIKELKQCFMNIEDSNYKDDIQSYINCVENDLLCNVKLG